MTNTRITHATPSSAYAHSGSRYWESDADLDDDVDCEDIASQLISNEYAQQFKVGFSIRKMLIPLTFSVTHHCFVEDLLWLLLHIISSDNTVHVVPRKHFFNIF